MERGYSGGVGWSLLVVRLVLGSTFILHGSQKVLGLFGGPGLEGFSGFVQKQFGLPQFLGYLAAFCEFIGGWMVLLGIATEAGALLIVPVMLVAMFRVHWAAGYFLPKGFEYALNQLCLCLVLLLGGPGKLALWNPFRAWRR